MLSREPPPNPFVGLRPFDEDEALFFFGRDEQTVELLERLHRRRLLAVVGSSGCGKSSLVRAGLIPRLKAGLLVEERDRWQVAAMKPGSEPLERLGAALGAGEVHGGARPLLEGIEPRLSEAAANLLLLVDQFEELFRFGMKSGDPVRREAASDFVRLLLDLAGQREVPIYVVITMRSDFLGDCDQFRGLPEALNDSQYLVPRLTRQKRRQVIEGPARLFGRAVEERLVTRLLNDGGEASDQLPILQHTLMRMWDASADGGVLGLDAYVDVGGLDEAISRHAAEALAEVDQRVAEKVFRALTETDARQRQIRRPRTLGQLVEETGGDRAAIVAVLDAFRAEERSFLMPPPRTKLEDGTLVDISHESLIRQWDRLQE